MRHAELNEDSWKKKPVKTIISVRKPNQVILPEDRLRIHRIAIKSPGFWEFFGNINPLEVLRKYLCDRHERKKMRHTGTDWKRSEANSRMRNFALKLLRKM